MMPNGYAPEGRSGMKAATAVREEVREVLVFVLGQEEYGVDILKVQEIRGYYPPIWTFQGLPNRKI